MAGLSFLKKHPATLFHAWGEEMAQKLGGQRWNLWLKSKEGCYCLCLVSNNTSSTQETCKSPVVGSPERCHADAPSNKVLVSQLSAPSGFASAAASCLVQRPLWMGRWTQLTLVIQKRLLASLWERLILLPNFFNTTTPEKEFYLDSSLREMKEAAWDWKTWSRDSNLLSCSLRVSL